MNRGVIFLMVGMLCLSPLNTYVGEPPTPEDIQQAQARLKDDGMWMLHATHGPAATSGADADYRS